MQQIHFNKTLKFLFANFSTITVYLGKNIQIFAQQLTTHVKTLTNVKFTQYNISIDIVPEGRDLAASLKSPNT